MSDKEILPQRIVTLRDEATGEQLDMEVVVEVEVEGREYALLTPLDPTVRLVRLEGEDEETADLEEVDDPDALKDMQSAINDALKPLGVRVRRRGGRYALEGELPEEVYDDADEVTAEADDEEEDFLKIAELDSGAARYWLLLPLELELHAVELKGDQARELEDDELEALHETFEAALEGLDDLAGRGD